MKPPLLLFDWPHRHRIQFLLPAAIFVAILAHAGVLVLIGIVHPAPRFDGPNPARVYYLSPSSASHSRIQGLLLSSDPALYAPKHGLPPSDIATPATYTPQFESANPSLIGLSDRPRPREAFPPFSARVELPAPTHRFAPRLVSPGKSLHLTGNLATRATDDSGMALVFPDTPTVPDPPSFLVGISPAGEVVHIAPIHPTGDPAADNRLINVIRSLRFSPADTPGTAWGTVEIRPGATQ